MNLPRFTTDLLVDWDYKVESTVTALFLVKQPPRNPVNSLIWYFKTTLSFSKHLTTLHRAPLSVHSSHTSDCIHYYFRWNVSNSDKLHFPLLLSPACLPARLVPYHLIGYIELWWRYVTSWSGLHDGGVHDSSGTLTTSGGVQFILTLNCPACVCQQITVTEILVTEYLMKWIAGKQLSVLK